MARNVHGAGELNADNLVHTLCDCSMAPADDRAWAVQDLRPQAGLPPFALCLPLGAGHAVRTHAPAPASSRGSHGAGDRGGLLRKRG